MQFSQYLLPVIVLIVGLAPSNVVLAVPLGGGGIGGLGSLGGIEGGGGGSSGPLGGILGSLGGNLGSGGGILRRTTSQPEYINSPQTDTVGSCNVGTAQCCQSLHQTSSFRNQAGAGALLAMIPLDDLMVGLQCSPIAEVVPVLGGASTCNSKPVCCSGNTYDGLINLGCSPISL